MGNRKHKPSPDAFMNDRAYAYLQACAKEREWDDSIRDEARSWSIAAANADGLIVAEERHIQEAIEIVLRMPHGMLEQYGDGYRARFQKIVDCLVGVKGLESDPRYK